MSCKLTLGLGFANGYREWLLRGDDTSTCRWNSRVPGCVESAFSR